MEVDSEDRTRLSEYNNQSGATLDPYAGWMLNFLGGEGRVYRRAEPGSLGMFTMATPVANDGLRSGLLSNLQVEEKERRWKDMKDSGPKSDLRSAQNAETGSARLRNT